MPTLEQKDSFNADGKVSSSIPVDKNIKAHLNEGIPPYLVQSQGKLAPELENGLGLSADKVRIFLAPGNHVLTPKLVDAIPKLDINIVCGEFTYFRLAGLFNPAPEPTETGFIDELKQTGRKITTRLLDGSLGSNAEEDAYHNKAILDLHKQGVILATTDGIFPEEASLTMSSIEKILPLLTLGGVSLAALSLRVNSDQTEELSDIKSNSQSVLNRVFNRRSIVRVIGIVAGLIAADRAVRVMASTTQGRNSDIGVHPDLQQIIDKEIRFEKFQESVNLRQWVLETYTKVKNILRTDVMKQGIFNVAANITSSESGTLDKSEQLSPVNILGLSGNGHDLEKKSLDETQRSITESAEELCTESMHILVSLHDSKKQPVQATDDSIISHFLQYSDIFSEPYFFGVLPQMDRPIAKHFPPTPRTILINKMREVISEPQKYKISQREESLLRQALTKITIKMWEEQRQAIRASTTSRSSVETPPEIIEDEIQEMKDNMYLGLNDELKRRLATPREWNDSVYYGSVVSKAEYAVPLGLTQYHGQTLPFFRFFSLGSEIITGRDAVLFKDNRQLTLGTSTYTRIHRSEVVSEENKPFASVDITDFSEVSGNNSISVTINANTQTLTNQQIDGTYGRENTGPSSIYKLSSSDTGNNLDVNYVFLSTVQET